METTSSTTTSTESNETILFNSKTKGFSFLSNSYITDITIDGILYCHAEGYYQSSRLATFNSNAAKHVASIYSPLACRRVSNNYFIPTEKIDEWNTGLKVKVMKRVILTKFNSTKELRDMLLSTGTANLVHNAPNDEYWGSGKEGRGQNVLGKILMEVRESIRRSEDHNNFYF